MRRTLIIALAVLALSVSVCAVGATAVHGALGQADGLRQQAVQAMRLGDAAGALRAMQSLHQLWGAQWRKLELVTSHDALSDVQGSIEDALVCLEHGEQLEFLRAVSDMSTALGRIRATESVRLMNLF